MKNCSVLVSADMRLFSLPTEYLGRLWARWDRRMDLSNT
jgi:hypothetical protein